MLGCSGDNLPLGEVSWICTAQKGKGNRFYALLPSATKNLQRWVTKLNYSAEPKSPLFATIDPATNQPSTISLTEKQISKLVRLRISNYTAQQKRMASQAAHDVYHRTIYMLASLGVEKRIGRALVTYLENRPTHKELSALVGTTREVITRTLTRLEEEKHIKIVGKSLYIHSMPS